MLSLPELSETYKNSHPQYINPLAFFDVTDHELAKLKREGQLPHHPQNRSLQLLADTAL